MGEGAGSVRRRALLAAAAFSFTGFLALSAVAAQHQWFGVDHNTREVLRLTRGHGLDTSMQMISLLGDRSGLIPLIGLASLLLWRGRRRWALALPVIMTGTGGLQLIAKWAVDRPRPNLAAWGFPSGHVLSVVVLLGLLAYLACTARRGRQWGVLGAGVGGGTVLAVAFSRLYLDVHWLSDVAAGFMLGLAYLLVTIWAAEYLGYRSASGPAVGDAVPSSLATTSP